LVASILPTLRIVVSILARPDVRPRNRPFVGRIGERTALYQQRWAKSQQNYGFETGLLIGRELGIPALAEFVDGTGARIEEALAFRAQFFGFGVAAGGSPIRHALQPAVLVGGLGNTDGAGLDAKRFSFDAFS